MLKSQKKIVVILFGLILIVGTFFVLGTSSKKSTDAEKITVKKSKSHSSVSVNSDSTQNSSSSASNNTSASSSSVIPGTNGTPTAKEQSDSVKHDDEEGQREAAGSPQQSGQDAPRDANGNIDYQKAGIERSTSDVFNQDQSAAAISARLNSVYN